jgi:hypothetical protein
VNALNRWLLTLLSAILAISIVGTASAAAAPKASKVQVTLNGQKIVFAQDPVIIQNKTYVEFRTLFSKLGYHIEYTTKTGTIKATAPGHRIQMSAGGSTALVDGKKVSSKGQMKLVNNRRHAQQQRCQLGRYPTDRYHEGQRTDGCAKSSCFVGI